MPLGEVGGPVNGTRSFSWPVDCETNHTSCRVDGPAPMEPDAATAPFQVVYAGQAILSDLSTDVEDIVDGALCGCRRSLPREQRADTSWSGLGAPISTRIAPS